MLDEITSLLLDIEGTTTSISFVKDVLFPYARTALEIYLHQHWGEPELDDDIELLKKQVQQDIEAGTEGVPVILSDEHVDDIVQSIITNVEWQMDMDRKTTALKQLQGHIWRDGYKTGALKGHLYPDVLPALRHFVAQGKKVYIYSSGSVEAQKLLFGYSVDGDILPLLSGHYDTKVGPKTESSSYEKIASQMGESAATILFLTDIPNEARAARSAGLKTRLVIREGNAPLSAEDVSNFNPIRSFADL